MQCLDCQKSGLCPLFLLNRCVAAPVDDDFLALLVVGVDLGVGVALTGLLDGVVAGGKHGGCAGGLFGDAECLADCCCGVLDGDGVGDVVAGVTVKLPEVGWRGVVAILALVALVHLRVTCGGDQQGYGKGDRFFHGSLLVG